jgi:hypothetical protein
VAPTGYTFTRGDGLTYGSTRYAECDAGYSGSGTITCGADAMWNTASLPGCSILNCGTPRQTGYVFTITSSAFGDSGTAVCATGFAGGTPSTITCLRDGTWSAATGCDYYTLTATDISRASCTRIAGSSGTAAATSGGVLQFTSIPNSSTNPAVLRCDITVPYAFSSIEGTFTLTQVGSNRPDDNWVAARWGQQTTNDYGFIAMGTPNALVSPGGARGSNVYSGTVYSISRTSVPQGTVLRFETCQSTPGEDVYLGSMALRLYLPCTTGYDVVNGLCVDTDGCAGVTCSSGLMCNDRPAPGSGYDCLSYYLLTTRDISAASCSRIAGNSAVGSAMTGGVGVQFTGIPTASTNPAVVRCDITVPGGGFVQVEGSYFVSRVDSNAPDDNSAASAWGQQKMSDLGYIASGTPAQIIVAGGTKGSNVARNTRYDVAMTSLSAAATVWRFETSQSTSGENVYLTMNTFKFYLTCSPGFELVDGRCRDINGCSSSSLCASQAGTICIDIKAPGTGYTCSAYYQLQPSDLQGMNCFRAGSYGSARYVSEPPQGPYGFSMLDMRGPFYCDITLPLTFYQVEGSYIQSHVDSTPEDSTIATSWGQSGDYMASGIVTPIARIIQSAGHTPTGTVRAGTTWRVPLTTLRTGEATNVWRFSCRQTGSSENCNYKNVDFKFYGANCSPGYTLVSGVCVNYDACASNPCASPRICYDRAPPSMDYDCLGYYTVSSADLQAATCSRVAGTAGTAQYLTSVTLGLSFTGFPSSASNPTVLRCDIPIPVQFLTVEGSFTLDRSTSNLPDDNQPCTTWGMQTSSDRGYFAWGTPDQIVDGGGRRSSNIAANTVTTISRVTLAAPARVLRVDVCQSAVGEDAYFRNINFRLNTM